MSSKYLTNDDLHLNRLNSKFKISKIGCSVNNEDINVVKVGNGNIKVLAWSQMHGNESTSTKSLLDFINALNNDEFINILDACTLHLIPILNPDGARAYTRENYNKVDLNRDAQERSQVESKLFKALVDKVKPLVAFNLHGQRTIFSAGQTNNSAIVSFLSPASDQERTITDSRKKGMRIIAEMNKALQTVIPNCIGRYDDGFNINCTGDTMEDSGYTTILFEAGHHPGDYERETTRKWMYLSLITALDFITKNELTIDKYEAYFDIPENEKCFKDVIVRNFLINNVKKDVSLQYLETLVDGKLTFVPRVAEISSQISDFGHFEVDSSTSKIVFSNVLDNCKIDDIIDYLSIDDEIFSVFPIKK